MSGSMGRSVCCLTRDSFTVGGMTGSGDGHSLVVRGMTWSDDGKFGDVGNDRVT